MACEARIVRILRTMEFPGLVDDSWSSTTGLSLIARPDSLSKIVSWIEDTKVRGLAISDREPLRTPGPGWEAAFFDYLREMGCPGDLRPAGRNGDGGGADSSAVLRGLSWLVDEAVACDFEDNGKEYVAAARQLLSEDGSPPRRAVEGPTGSGSEQQNEGSWRTNTAAGTADVVTTGKGGFPQEERLVFPELEGFAAGVETGSDACDSVASVLRMLFLSDLRNLQDEVNGIIALAQSSRTAAAEAVPQRAR
ncbi:unnamed protein product [Hapterophycus canaliculatus]